MFKFSERRAALDAADAAALSDAQAAHDASVEQMYAYQAELDTWWAAMQRCDPDAVMSAVAAAFEDNSARAAIAGVHDTETSLVVVVPGVDEVPERKPTRTAAGNLSLKKLTKTETGEVYKALLVGHLLLTVREAFAVAPALTSARILAIRMSSTNAYGHQKPEPLVAASFSRTRLAGVNWTAATAANVLRDCADDVLISEKGTAREIQVLDLASEPALAEVLSLVGADNDAATADEQDG